MDVFLSILNALSYIGCLSMLISVLAGLAYIEDTFKEKRTLKKIMQIIYVLSMFAFVVEFALRVGGYV